MTQKNKTKRGKEVLASEFGKKIAKVMMDLKSSHCYFILQMAYGEELSWSEAEDIMNKVIKEN